MNFLNRAWKYVTRRLSKSILLGLTFFLVGNLILMCLGVTAATENAKTMARKSMKAVVSYELDYKEISKYAESLVTEEEMEEFYRKNYPKLTSEDALAIFEGDKRILAMNYMVTNMSPLKDGNSVPIGNQREQDRNEGDIETVNGIESDNYKEPNIQLIGNIVPTMIEFVDGTYTIVDGRFYTEDEIEEGAMVVVITQELALENGWSIGDTFAIERSFYWGVEDLFAQGYTEEDFYKEFEIIGIYETTKEVDQNSPDFDWLSAWQSPKNHVLVPALAIARFNQETEEMYSKVDGWGREEEEERELEDYIWVSQIVYLLDDPMNVDGFIKDNSANLKEFSKFNANTEEFDKVAAPLNSLSATASVIFWIIVINSVIIISLVIALTMKTREFEIGVLLSTGASKIKVVGQLFAEMVIIAIIGFSLAAFSGVIAAEAVGDWILDTQISRQEEPEEDDFFGGGYYDTSEDYFTEVSQEELIGNYKVSISPWLVLQIYGLGILVVLISIIVPSFMIMRLNPKQILLN